MKDALKKYELLRKKYKLPAYPELQKEFEVGELEGDFTLRYIRKDIFDFLDVYVGTIEETIHPDSSLSSLYEYKMFNDEQKERLFGVYRKLMKLLRQALATSLVNSEAEDARFIRASLAQWRDIRKALLPLAEQLRDSWEKDTSPHEDLGYLG
jgi:hypothetical protein